MSEMRDRNFVPELVYRTKVNYYAMRLRDTKEEEEIRAGFDEAKKKELLKKKQWYSEELERLKDEMNTQKFDVDNYYEVTLLLNSLIGLLVFPQQKYFEEIKECLGRIERFPELNELINRRGFFYSSYKEAKKKPSNIIRHLKNALSHQRVMIIPQSLKLHEEEKNSPITHIVFQDADDGKLGTQKRNETLKENVNVNVNGIELDLEELTKIYDEGKAVFCLVVPVENLENLIMELCDAIVSWE